MKMTLKNYMDRVGEIYKTAAGEVVKDAERLEELKAKRAGVWADRGLTLTGKHTEDGKLAEETHAVNRHIAEVQANARKAALAVRAEVEKAFFDYYNAKPADYDEKTAQLINSGALTEKELLHMADGASRVMRRVIGARLAESEDEMIAFKGRTLQQTSTNPHLDAIDGMMGAGLYVTGGGQSGPGGAAEFLRRWDYITRPVYDAAPDVGYEYDTTTGEERHFYEGA